MGKRGITPEQAEKIRLKRGIGKETKLRVARLKKGISQRTLSVESGVGFKSVVAYEQGVNSIDRARFDTICRLCKALECRIADIIESEKTIDLYNEVK